MIKKLMILMLFFMVVLAASAFAAETAVKGTIYSNWLMDLTDGKDNANVFTIDRAYFGAESKLSDYTFMRITFDVRPERFITPETKTADSEGDSVTIPKLTAYSGLPIILKYAYADWKIKPVAQYFKVRLGLQPTMHLNNMDGIWNRRYVEKNIIDLNSWLSTADLGVSFIFTMGPQGSLGEAGLSIFNGTKYSDIVEKNKNKDLNLYGKLMPFYNSGDFNQVAVFAQFYSGTQNKEIAETDRASDWKNQIISVGGKLGYQKKVDLCFDANFHTLGQGGNKNNLKQSGISFWGNVYLNPLVPSTPLFKTLVLFGRIDLYDPNTDGAANKDGNMLFLGGVECAPIKGVKGSLAFRNKTYQNDNKVDEKAFFVNTEFKF